MDSEEDLPSAAEAPSTANLKSASVRPDTLNVSPKQQCKTTTKHLLGSSVPPKYTGQAGKGSPSHERYSMLHSSIPKYNKRSPISSSPKPQSMPPSATSQHSPTSPSLSTSITMVQPSSSTDTVLASMTTEETGSSQPVYKGVCVVGTPSPSTKRRNIKAQSPGTRIPSPASRYSQSPLNVHRNSTGSAIASHSFSHKPPITRQSSLSQLPVYSEGYSSGMKRSSTTSASSEQKSSMLLDSKLDNTSNNNSKEKEISPVESRMLSSHDQSNKDSGIPSKELGQMQHLSEGSSDKSVDVENVINNPEYPEMVRDICEDDDDNNNENSQSPIEDTSVMISSFSEHLDRLAKLYDAEKLGVSYPQPPKSFTMNNLALSDRSFPSSPTPGSTPLKDRAKKLIKRSSSSLSDSPALLSQRQRALWIANSRTHPNITVYKGSWCMRNGILSVRSQEKLNQLPVTGLNEFSTGKKAKDINIVFEEPKNSGLNVFAEDSLTSLATRKIVKCASREKNLNVESDQQPVPTPRRFGLLEKCRSLADFSVEGTGLNMFNSDSERINGKRKNDDDFDWPSAAIITRIRLGRSRSVS